MGIWIVPVDKVRKAIADGALICPSCNKPIRKFDKYVDMVASVWDGAGDSNLETGGSKVTLICGNDDCSWTERTEYWDSFLS